MKKVKIMGILNITPDSFYDGGRYLRKDDAVRQALKLKRDGADIIDIGGESTRPGSRPVSADEQTNRVCPVIESIIHEIGVAVSVDTTRADVAREALRAGAEIINDISGLTFDSQMADVVKEYNAGLVIMHIKGRPESMQKETAYNDILGDIYAFLESSRDLALSHGIASEKIIIDPGIGFGKSMEDNYVILNNISYFKRMGPPVLIGLSRKSLIGRLYNDDSDRLPATIALNTVSIINGADIIRVHDVKEHRLALDSLEVLEKVS